MTNKLLNSDEKNADIDSPSAALELLTVINKNQRIVSCIYVKKKTEDEMGGLKFILAGPSLTW